MDDDFSSDEPHFGGGYFSSLLDRKQLLAFLIVLLITIDCVIVLIGSLIMRVGLEVYYVHNELKLLARVEIPSALPLTIYAMGAAIILSTWVNCWGVYRKSPEVLMGFVYVFSIVIVLQILLGSVTCFYHSWADQVEEKSMRATLELHHSADRSDIRAMWDSFQNEHICCGVNRPWDWVDQFKALPKSCGTRKDAGQRVGCKEVLIKRTNTVLLAAGGFIAGTALIQITAIVLVLHIVRRLRRRNVTELISR